MDLVVPRLPRRNVEVYNSEKAVIAGMTRQSPRRLIFVDKACRLLAVWYFPVGRVLQILDHIHRYPDRLGHFPI
jgi:hypothetical protein